MPSMQLQRVIGQNSSLWLLGTALYSQPFLFVHYTYTLGTMTEDNFQSSFDSKAKNKLRMKGKWLTYSDLFARTCSKTECIDFWTTEPCNWTITNYLAKLIAQDPAVTRRVASNVLINDATVIKKHVVAGTVAETMANAMASYAQVSFIVLFTIITSTVINQPLQHSRTRTTFYNFFVNYAAQMTQETLKYGVQKV